MSQPEPEQRRTVTEARQGVTGHNVRAVLFSGLALAILAGLVLFFTVGQSTPVP